MLCWSAIRITDLMTALLLECTFNILDLIRKIGERDREREIERQTDRERETARQR